MSKYTTHYNLEKPNISENYDVNVANKNNDMIDEELYKKVEKVAGKDLSTNDFTDGYKKKVDKMVEGTRGYSSYEIALQNGFKGTEVEWLESLKGEKRRKRRCKYRRTRRSQRKYK
ncbi:MAG: hypothetical protein ACLVAK_07920 [Clostridia bacterium]|jgi:hypothetical protein